MSDAPVKLMPSDLAALMCGRICHDLISPVGALGTALEVLGDDANADMHEDAMELVKTSARQASAKLQFLRMAFGSSSSAPGVLSPEKVKDLTMGVFGEGKATLHWNMDVDGIDKTHARLLMNFVMMAVQCVPRGGDITIRVTEDENINMRLDAKGPKARLDEKIAKALSGKAPEDGFDGRTIQAFYAGLICRERSGRVQAAMNTETETATIAARMPKKAEA